MGDTIILVVDDDQAIVHLCQRVLGRASYQVITAVEPHEVLKILERQKVNLLLSDIYMPGMNGFDLIIQAKKLQPTLPVLIMTSFGSVDNALQALNRGVDGLILKPFENTADLVQAVKKVLEDTQQRQDAARLHVLRPLFDITERLLAETSLQSLETLILNSMTGLFQVSCAWIYRLERDGADLELVRMTETNPSIATRAAQQEFFQNVISAGIPVVLNASGPGIDEETRRILQTLGWETLLVAPVRRGNSQFVFCAGREPGGIPFAEADLELFVILARQSTVALENARLYSELKDYVHQVELSQRELIQAEKMAAMGRLTASLAHEINNPLQAVSNCLHLALREDIGDKQRLNYINLSNHELERLLSTVQQMLDFYRPSGVEKRPADVHQLVDQVLALLGPQLNERHIAMHVQYQGIPTLVLAMPDQIKQVIFNLILNAVDALEEGVNRKSSEKEIWINIYYEEHQIRILIEDSGPGVPENMRDHIFEPFVSTKQQGTGLGLAVSYGIMESHQGSLTLVPPHYKTGACFEVILPSEVERENGKNIDCR